jgi:ABC-2 type transport system permease protein
MITTIARKEMTEMMRDGRFRWSATITLLLLAGALALGWQQYREVSAQHESARKATRESWLAQGEKNPHSAAHYGVYAFKPKMPLSLVDQGVDPYVGVATWLEAHKQNEFKFKPAQDATALARLGEMTGATVLQLLLPLLIVLLTFSAFSAEREQGTLRQLLSLGVKRTDLTWGKALGIAYGMAALLVPATILGVGALALTSENGSLWAAWPRLVLMIAVYLLYFAAFIGVSLAVSARARSSRVALIALLGFWIFNGLVAPKAVADMARVIYPSPSALEFAMQIEHDLENGINGHDPSDKRGEELKQRLMKQYNVDSVAKLPINFAGISMQEGEEYGNRVFDKHYGELWNTYDRQRRIHEASAVFAPVLAVRSLSMALSGTDFAQHAHFTKAAEDYRRLINREMNLDLAYNMKGNDYSGTYVRGRDLWEKIPEFTYTAPDLGWVMSRQQLSMAILFGWTAMAVAAAFLAARALRV